MENNLKQYIGKPIQEVVEEAEKIYNNSKAFSTDAIKMLQLCINTPSIDKYYKGILIQKVWEIEKSMGNHINYFSQAGQDRYIENICFKGKKKGKFVEIGAYDGILGSNSLYFEKSTIPTSNEKNLFWILGGLFSTGIYTKITFITFFPILFLFPVLRYQSCRN